VRLTAVVHVLKRDEVTQDSEDKVSAALPVWQSDEKGVQIWWI
jgi:hypothetical protein